MYVETISLALYRSPALTSGTRSIRSMDIYNLIFIVAISFNGRARDHFSRCLHMHVIQLLGQ